MQLVKGGTRAPDACADGVPYFIKKGKMKTVKELLSQIKKDYMCLNRKYKNWTNNYKDATHKVRFVNGVTLHYAHKLGMSQREILNAFEEARKYWSANYYQQGQQPRIGKNVIIYETKSHFLKEIVSNKFRCPHCKGISTDPETCNSGEVMSPGKRCDWKAYGLFGTLGKGLRFIIKEEFFKSPKVHNIFMPVELEKRHKETANPAA